MAAEGEERPAVVRRLGVGAAIVVVLAAVAVTVGIGMLRGAVAPVEVVPTLAESSTAPVDAHPADRHQSELTVHVAGAVAVPGVYVLAADARVLDAVAAAGGFAATADPGSVNLARPLADGEQLVVTEVGEAPPVPSSSTGSAAGQGSPVNLNTADEATLDTLPRIGPALAARIIEWREKNGPFNSAEDLLAVPGIGDKMLEGIRDLVVW